MTQMVVESGLEFAGDRELEAIHAENTGTVEERAAVIAERAREAVNLALARRAD